MIQLIKNIFNKKKTKVINLQQLAGLLNFISHGVVPSHCHTRVIYMKFKGMEQHHHVKVHQDIWADCNMWLTFLNKPTCVSCPFLDLSKTITADELNWYTDASGNADLGCGVHFNDRYWFSIKCQPDFMQLYNPSIEHLELYTVTVNVFLWLHKVQNRRILIFCDNESVMSMFNSTSSSCRNCLHLLRIIILHSMNCNTWIFAHHVMGI